jgi:uncharacterized LabA/DUF88 family protein
MKEGNFAFIDSQNVYLGIQTLGWKIDWRRFRVHLLETYHVTRAYLFLGYIPEYKDMYAFLNGAGYILKFKPVVFDEQKKVKGNIDADMVLQAVIDLDIYDQAVVVTSDGDFYSLVDYLYGKEKLKVVLSPNKEKCSTLLKRTAKEKIYFMNNLQKKIGKRYK